MLIFSEVSDITTSNNCGRAQTKALIADAAVCQGNVFEGACLRKYNFRANVPGFRWFQTVITSCNYISEAFEDRPARAFRRVRMGIMISLFVQCFAPARRGTFVFLNSIFFYLQYLRRLLHLMLPVSHASVKREANFLKLTWKSRRVNLESGCAVYIEHISVEMYISQRTAWTAVIYISCTICSHFVRQRIWQIGRSLAALDGRSPWRR